MVIDNLYQNAKNQKAQRYLNQEKKKNYEYKLNKRQRTNQEVIFLEIDENTFLWNEQTKRRQE